MVGIAHRLTGEDRCFSGFDDEAQDDGVMRLEGSGAAGKGAGGL